MPLKDSHESCLFWHLENGVALSTERKLVTISGQPINVEYLGKYSLSCVISLCPVCAGMRFNDDIYFFMSQRLLDS